MGAKVRIDVFRIAAMGLSGYSGCIVKWRSMMFGVLGLTATAAADVVIDMPPPPTAKTVPADGASALQQFAQREHAQDAAGRHRGVYVQRSIDPMRMWDWYGGYGWGWPGMWAVTPDCFGGGWVHLPCVGTVFNGTWMGSSASVNLRPGTSQQFCW